ncbi:MSCRAMM family adhesin SdrC [Rossellomorea aquimaris]|uniref:MSCRAMM family adhesin SdrC n=1 Tax=Rossellomorea aquimaris TaxID=189382 RepID=UPI001CFEF2E5|nr:MSCRAMM family adhesin SdrC [Rossellomorea aquimaris]
MNITRVFSLMLTFMILFWNVFPVVSMAAGTFITPGESIKPGQAITPGEAISGGEFLVPGDVFKPGQAIKPGESYNGGQVSNSGKPILENFPLNNGTFIIPNAPPPVPNFVFGGESFTTGGPITPGTPPNSGKSVEGGDVDGNGKSIEGGDVGGNGKSIEGGDVDGNGKSVEGGDVDGNGKSVEGGDVDGDGKSVEGGDVDGDGKSVEGGDVDGDGKSVEGGDVDGDGKSVEGGDVDGDGKSTEGGDVDGNGKSVKGVETLDEKLSSSLAWIKAAKRWGTDMLFAADDIVQGLVAHKAGYKFVKDGTKNWKLKGDRKTGNKVTQWFLDRFNDNDSINNGKKNFNNFRRNEFLDGKKLNGFTSNLKKSIRDKWIPFYKKTEEIQKKGWMKPKYVSNWTFNTKVLKPMQLIKGSAPVNFVLTTGQTLIDYTVGAKKSMFNTSDFYADLSTDLTIGAGTTLVGSIVGSAATGAVGGSIVPGLGTAIGAVAGIGVGVGSYFFMQSRPGKALRRGIRSGYKKAYDFVGNSAKKIGSKVGELGDKLKSGLGGIFG